MAKTTKWTTENIIKFLEAYEQYPCLWNYKMPEYKNRNLRIEALNKIVEVMSETVTNFNHNAAKAKIRSIRNAYTLEYHKVLKSYKSGTSTDDVYHPTVAWYPVANRFLHSIVEIRETQDNLKSQALEEDGGKGEESHESLIDYDDIPIEESETHTEPDNLVTPSSSHSSKSFGKRSQLKEGCEKNIHSSETPVKRTSSNIFYQPPVKKNRFDTVSAVTKAVDTLKEIAQQTNNSQSDEFELFGKTVAAHLRQLPINKALESQAEILNYLVQQRLGRPTSLVVTSPQPPQLFMSPCTSAVPSTSDSGSLFMDDTSDIVSHRESISNDSHFETAQLIRQAMLEADINV